MAEVTKKSERLNIRARGEEKEFVERAARASRVSTSQFVMQAALRSAEDVLSEQTRFVLPPDAWGAFVAELDRPAREISELKAAASKPSPFSER